MTSASACAIIDSWSRRVASRLASGLFSGHRTGRLGERGAIVAVSELDRQITGVHRLVVGNRHLGDQPADLGRDHRHLASYISTVGAFDEPPDRPPAIAVAGGRYPDSKHQTETQEPFDRQAPRHLREIAAQRGGNDPSLDGTHAELGRGRAHRGELRSGSGVCTAIVAGGGAEIAGRDGVKQGTQLDGTVGAKHRLEAGLGLYPSIDSGA